MISFFKAVPFGIFLTIIVALFIGSGGATGGILNVHLVDVVYPDYGVNFDFYWSWILFIGGTLLAFVFVVMMGD